MKGGTDKRRKGGRGEKAEEDKRRKGIKGGNDFQSPGCLVRIPSCLKAATSKLYVFYSLTNLTFSKGNIMLGRQVSMSSCSRKSIPLNETSPKEGSSSTSK